MLFLIRLCQLLLKQCQQLIDVCTYPSSWISLLVVDWNASHYITGIKVYWFLANFSYQWSAILAMFDPSSL